MKNTSLLLFLALTFGHGQTQSEWAPPDFIKSVQFQSSTTTAVFPVVQLGEIMTLSFDDLNADEADYYYRIKYYNSDWSPTTLFQNEYMDGFDNLRIANYTTSFNTLQKYTHYRLQIPNQAVQLKVSGNYMIEIYSADEELVFSR
ncbi:MAG: type IX secretion system plug protein domain-containing protein, partial [Flavobacteriaceae bacterium]